jgi:hypothetical protein
VAHETDLMAELERARDLLLNPHKAAMRDCELTLERAAGILRKSGLRREYGAQVKRTLQNLRFLLDRARAFWNSRPVAAGPGIQYASGGMIVPAATTCTFTIEV